MLAIVVEGNSNAPFLLATTLNVGQGATLFLGLPLFNFDLYLIMVSVEQGGTKYHFLEFLAWLKLGMNYGLQGRRRTLYPLVNVPIAQTQN